MRIASPRAIIFYGDITGFSTWSRRVRSDAVRDLIRDTYEIYNRWETRTRFWIKKEADGFIAVRDLAPTNDRAAILSALRSALAVMGEVNKYLRALPYPRPDSFRLRAVLGDVWRFDDLDGTRDYAGYKMNFGRRLLDIFKSERFICSEGVFDAIGRKGCAHLALRPLSLPEPLDLHGVDPEDQRHLWTLERRKRPRK